MSFDPVDYYHFAGILYSQENEDYPESYTRAAISRAYYSALLVARKHAGITNQSGSVHQDVYCYLNKNTKTRRIANNLNSLRIKRNDADYHVDKTMTSRDSGLALSYAKKILEGLGVDLTHNK